MFKTVKHYTALTLYFAKLSIQSQMEYPLFLLSWLIMVLSSGLQVFIC